MSFPTDIAIQTTFELVGTPKFKILNTTPIIDDGIDPSEFKGFVKIVNPLGITVYNNTNTSAPDFYTKSVSGITRSGTTASVTCTNHGLITGDYVLISGADQSAYNVLAKIIKVNINLFTYEVVGSPATPATGTIFMTKMSLNTIQIPLQSGATKPIEGDYTITITTVISGGTGEGTYVTPTSYVYSYVRPIVTIQQSVNIYIPTFTSVDTTTYMVGGIEPTLDRTQTIVFPTDSEIPSEDFTTQTVIINSPKVWNGIYQTNVVSNLSYTFGDGLIVSDRIYGTQPFVVAANAALNQITNVLNEYNIEYKTYQQTNPFKAEQIYALIDRANQLLTLYTNNIQYGNTDAANQNLSDIYQLLNVTPVLTGQVIPITNLIGQTILEYDVYAAVGFSAGNYVDYNNVLYRVLSNTLPNENPDDTPSKFQVVGNNAPVVVLTEGRTLLLSDAGKELDIDSATSETITIPNDTDVDFPIGTQILFSQEGAGVVSFDGAVGVTLNSLDGLTSISGQYGGAVLIKKDTNLWTLYGSLA